MIDFNLTRHFTRHSLDELMNKIICSPSLKHVNHAVIWNWTFYEYIRCAIVRNEGFVLKINGDRN